MHIKGTEFDCLSGTQEADGTWKDPPLEPALSVVLSDFPAGTSEIQMKSDRSFTSLGFPKTQQQKDNSVDVRKAS
ncbi:A-Kinase Anchor Protein 4 [Manis pentadactyla]|nr:A-Kinase Anchor Protein 4 [Manis pentadactyla]